VADGAGRGAGSDPGETTWSSSSIEPFGDAALLISSESSLLAEGPAWAQAVTRAIGATRSASPGIGRAVPAQASVLLPFDPLVVELADAVEFARSALAAAAAGRQTAAAILGREPGTEVFRELAEHPDDEQVRGVVAIRLDGGLFFATSDALEDRIREVIHSARDLTGVVLDCEGIDFIDSQGSAKLGDIVNLTQESGITLRLAGLKPTVSATLVKDGILDRIGMDKIHGSVDRGVKAQLDTSAARPEGP
jgi:anti-anti-sigma factor